MEQHPVPRQITTFEFKLIGFMTLKQFIYLIIFVPIAYIVFSVFPIPVLNFLLAAIIALFGVALAFVPINDRPLDVFIKNFLKRMSSPTQYFYNKTGQKVAVNGQLDPKSAANLADAKQKLEIYLEMTRVKNQKTEQTAANHTPLDESMLGGQGEAEPEDEAVVVTQTVEEADEKPAQEEKVDENKPYLVGEVKNNKQSPLPGVLVYIKNPSGKPVRLLKTNPNGVFATFNPLPKGEYTFEVKDPKGKFFFDTMKMDLEGQNLQPIEFFSKELI